MNDTIGIDISKDTLDTYWLSKRKHKQFANTKTGLRSLISWVREAEVPNLLPAGNVNQRKSSCFIELPDRQWPPCLLRDPPVNPLQQH
jgi:hypothetical protein